MAPQAGDAQPGNSHRGPLKREKKRSTSRPSAAGAKHVAALVREMKEVPH